ncbi:glycosyltransferase family 2 protein [Marinobacterium lutimaris]|uniref:Glycosyl transferase family 2 n=1 Tax=Marinobacterium lutimaris TaxID=568106 RepID=A0A1H6BA56_9GAMM|nr:glycosyltransferase family 2 protein [Marinobacterium lutimaris]SEG57245.1 Glycosyl transferase family 2 [Marinobacterium lutimaris]
MENFKITVSIIIPTCYSRNSVQNSVASVLNQNYPNLEVIVVDDNNTDCRNNLRQLLGNDRRIKIVRNSKKHGASQARNFGVNVASGELITFLDDDDCFMPGRLKSMVEVFNTVGNDYSFISSGRFTETGDFSGIELVCDQKFGRISMNDVIFSNNIDIGVLIKRDFFVELKGFDENLNSLEDWDLFIRALKIKDAYKIKRFDYVASKTDSDYRVSAREHKGYFDIAKKYGSQFGKKWICTMNAKGLLLSGRLSLGVVLLLSFKSCSIRPLNVYLSAKYPRTIRTLKKYIL